MALQEFKKPTTQKQMRSFLGCVGYFCKLIKDIRKMSALLSPAVSSKALSVVQWIKPMETAFSKLLLSLSNNVLVHIPQPGNQFQRKTDASRSGLRVVLHVIWNEMTLMSIR